MKYRIVVQNISDAIKGYLESLDKFSQKFGRIGIYRFQYENKHGEPIPPSFVEIAI